MPVETSRSATSAPPRVDGPRRPGEARGEGDEGAVLLPHRSSAVPAARRALVRSLAAARTRSGVVDDVAVIASELLGNAVRHAAPLAGGGVLLRWRAGCDVVELEVVDGGGGDPTARDAEATATCGRGLRIVESLARGWGTRTHRRGQRTVWAVVCAGEAMPRSA